MHGESRVRAAALNAVIDVPVMGFALWTVVCQVLVLSGARPLALTAAFPVVVGAVVLLAWRAWRARGGCSDASEPPTTIAPPATGRVVFRGLAALLVAAQGALWLTGASIGTHIMAAALGFLLLTLAQWTAREPDAPNRCAPSPAALPLLLLLGLLCAGVTSIANRPDIDEAFYLAVATSLTRFPELPLLSFDPIHGDPSIPLQMAAYRVHSLELLSGVLSTWLGPWPIRFMHVLFPACAALLLPFALFRAARELSPRLALPAVVLTLGVLLADGVVHKSFGNFALVRFYQGKAIFVTLMVPLLIAYGARLGRAPTLTRGVLLACGQVTAIGLTSTALPLAPVVAGLGVLVGLGEGGVRRAIRSVLGYMLATAYPLTLAVLLYVQMLGARAGRLQAQALAKVAEAPGMREASDALPALLHEVLGQGFLFGAFLGTCLLAPLLAPLRVARLAATSGAVFLCLLGNPALRPLIAQHVLGQSTYWRALWVVPLPLLLGLTLVSLGRARPLRSVGPWVAAGIGLLVLAQGTPRGTLSERNKVRAPVEALKVAPEFRVARHAAQLLPEGGVIAMHGQVGRWLPAMPQPVYPIFVKNSYLRDAQRKPRTLLHACVAGRPLPPCAGPPLRHLLHKLHVREVAMPRGVVRHQVADTLRRAGYIEQTPALGFRFWVAATETQPTKR